MFDPAVPMGIGLVRKMSVGLLHVRGARHEAPDRREVRRHASVNLRQYPVSQFGGKRLDAHARGAQVEWGAGCDGLLHRCAAGFAIGGVVRRENILQSGKKSRVSGVVHGGSVSGRCCHADIGAQA